MRRLQRGAWRRRHMVEELVDAVHAAEPALPEARHLLRHRLPATPGSQMSSSKNTWCKLPNCLQAESVIQMRGAPLQGIPTQMDERRKGAPPGSDRDVY